MPKNDERFRAIASDPRFKLPKKKAVKSQIDARFKDALEGDEFNSKVKTDRYGRKITKKTAKEQLKRFYDFDEEKTPESKEANSDSISEADSESSDSEGVSKPSLLDRMRGNAEDSNPDSSSESESESDSDSEAEEDVEEQVDEYDLGKSEVVTGDESRRLAVVNLDWDNLRAIDLMVTFNSFVPKGNRINSVSIYPSEFGKKRMSEEELKGPGLFEDKPDRPTGKSSSKSAEHDRDLDFSSSALRKYQLQRLQYYYAIVDCDTIGTAASIYNNCDGSEYEATANIFDLRYVPDDVEFDDKPTDECTSIPLNYNPQEFITSALQHSKAKLTWDETPKERQEFAAKAFSKAEEEDMDLQAYLASESDSDGGNTAAEKYRALLAAPTEKDEDLGDMNMEITFNPALEGESTSIESTKKEQDPMENMSTIDKYRLKEKERRQKRMERSRARKAEEEEKEEVDEAKKKAELELVLMDDHNAQEDEEDTKDKAKGKKKYKQTKTREKKQAIADAETDFNTADPRFQALFEDPDYAIDSTNPQFKKTKAMDKVLDERRRRTPKEDKPNPKRKAPKHKEESVSDLVTSLRNKKIRTKH